MFNVFTINMVQEDWAEDCRKEPNFVFKTVSMVDRERDGLPMYEHKPDGVEMVSYSTFYDSMFELADDEYGRTGKARTVVMHSFAS